MFKEVEFAVTDGTILRGRLYSPAATEKATPIIVMASGFSGTMDLRMFPFAEAFANAGLSVLLYDHRNYGLSDGAIRQETDPNQQLNDWRDAITYASVQSGVDPNRVGVWGTSFSGGHVLVLGATDARVKCVVAQVPFISGSLASPRGAMAEMMNASLAADRVSRLQGGAPAMLPIITNNPAQPAVLGTPDAYEFTMRHMGDAPTWRNEVTLRSMELSGAYEPGSYIDRIGPKPLLMIVGKRDHLTLPEVALKAYAQALEPKELLLLDGGHFDPYERLQAESSAAAANWFAKHLL